MRKNSTLINSEVILLCFYILFILMIFVLIEVVKKYFSVSFLMKIPTSALEWPLLGGFCAVLYQLAHIHIPGNGEIVRKKNQLSWMIVKPFTSMIIGSLSYMLLMAGNILLTDTEEIKNKYFIDALVFIVGFSDKFGITYLYAIANRFVNINAVTNKR